MDFSVFSVNVWAVLVSGVAYFAIGAVWYMVLSEPWMKGIGKTQEDLDQNPLPYITSFICEVLIAFGVAVGINAFGATGIMDAIFVASALWFGFSLLPTIVHYAYEEKTFSLLAINKGYDLIGMIVASIILTLWR